MQAIGSRPGILGFFDDDGYLFLAGRIREIINRGGEKVAPQEVDEVLLEHPAVAEAVTFAVPHATLGEDVASAIVLRPRAAATPKDIRQFAIGRIADFKVPRQVLIVSGNPKRPDRQSAAYRLGGETGSRDQQRARRGPSSRHGRRSRKRWPNAGQRSFRSSRSVSTMISSRWAATLSSATRVLTHVHDITQVEVEVSRFFEAPTVAEVAQHLETLIQAGQAPRPSSAIVRVPREDGIAPASIAQERLCEAAARAA